MKGFAVTPILFIGLFVVAGIMLITFGDIQRKMDDSIEKQAILRNLGSEAMEKRMSEESLLYFASVSGTLNASNTNQLVANITRILGKTATITDCKAGHFTSAVGYSFIKTQQQASINDIGVISRNITCGDIQSLGKAPTSITCPSSAVFSCP